jgi:toxin ParE1/3/4
MLNKIKQTCLLYAGHPGMGTPRGYLMPGLRSFTVGIYMVFYLPLEDGIDVVRILHGMRDLEALFENPGA